MEKSVAHTSDYSGPRCRLQDSFSAARARIFRQARIAALLIVAALCFSHIHQGSLMIDSVRYAHIAYLLEQSGDWLYLHDEFKDSAYSNKPPVLFWLVALSLKIFGLSTFAVKLPAVLFVSLGLYLLWELCARSAGLRAAFLTLILLAGNRVFFRSVVDLNFEGMVLCGAVCCLRTYVLLLRGETPGRSHLLVFLVGILLLLSAKPPYVLFMLLPGLVVLAYRRPLAKRLSLTTALAFGATIVLGLSWMAFMASASFEKAVDNQIMQPLSIAGAYSSNAFRWARALCLEFAPLSWIGMAAMLKMAKRHPSAWRSAPGELLLYSCWLAPALPIMAWLDFQSRYLLVPLLPLAIVGGKFLAPYTRAISLGRITTASIAASSLAFILLSVFNLPVHQKNLALELLRSRAIEDRPRIMCLNGSDGIATKPTRKRMGMLIELEFGFEPEVSISTTLGRTSAKRGDLLLVEHGCKQDLAASGVPAELLADNARFSIIRLLSDLPEQTRSGHDDTGHFDYH